MSTDKHSSDRRQAIQSNLNLIVDASEKLLQRLRGRERSVRLASAFLTGFLGFVVSIVIGSAITQSIIYVGRSHYQSFLFELDPKVALAAVGFSFLVALVSGIATYFLLKRKHEARLKELSSLITEMKVVGQQQNIASGHGMTEDGLSLVDKITTLLPELVRKRNQDSLLFGVVAFIVSEIAGRNLPIAILIGAIVWLYFRYETSKIYERQISKLEEQREAFEQRKNNLLETLSALP